MRSLAASINNLIPFISESESAGTAKQNKEDLAKIEDLNRAVGALKGQVQKHGGSNAAKASDPMFNMLVANFSEDIDRATQAYKNGNVQYARAVLRGTVAYCNGCHTRTENTSKFKFPIFPEAMKKLSLPEKMKFFAANRRFDEALKVFNEYLDGNKMQSMDSYEFEKSVEIAVSILVRVQDNADPAIALLKKVRKADQTSENFAKELDGWEAALLEWKKEKQPTLDSNSQYFSRAKELYNRAAKRQDFPFDRKANVDYLRATALMHKLLESHSDSKDVSEVYFMLGKSYEVLQDLGIWSLHEHYYEACIREAPKTALASECFKSFEESVTMGFTGSSGTKLPSEVKQKLKTLKGLSQLK